MLDKSQEISRRNARRNARKGREYVPLDVDALMGKKKKKKKWDEEDESWRDR